MGNDKTIDLGAWQGRKANLTYFDDEPDDVYFILQHEGWPENCMKLNIKTLQKAVLALTGQEDSI